MAHGSRHRSERGGRVKLEGQPAPTGFEGTDVHDGTFETKGKASGEKAADKRLEEIAKGVADLETLHIRWINLSLCPAAGPR